MLRHRSLIPLSHQHQHALALCVRIERALPSATVDLNPWQAEIAQIFEQEIQFHFAAEEQELFPVARRFAQLASLVDLLIEEHGLLRKQFVQAQTGTMNATDLAAFAKQLPLHIRKEERQLFEELQKLLSAEELASLGAKLEKALQSAARTCGIQRPVRS